MSSDAWNELLHAAQRSAQLHPLPQRWHHLTLYFDPCGQVVDTELHFDLSDLPASPAPAPAAVSLTGPDHSLLDKIADELEKEEPRGLKTPDLAVRLGYKRNAGYFRGKVRDYLTDGQLRKDEEGFLHLPD